MFRFQLPTNLTLTGLLRRALKQVGRSERCDFPTDSCKFPTKVICLHMFKILIRLFKFFSNRDLFSWKRHPHYSWLYSMPVTSSARNNLGAYAPRHLPSWKFFCGRFCQTPKAPLVICTIRSHFLPFCFFLNFEGGKLFSVFASFPHHQKMPPPCRGDPWRQLWPSVHKIILLLLLLNVYWCI